VLDQARHATSAGTGRGKYAVTIKSCTKTQRTDPSQCNLARPICGCCIRANAQCVYREIDSLRIRDQTEHVKSRFTNKSVAFDAKSVNHKRLAPLKQVQRLSPVQTVSLGPSWDQLSFCAFYDYVVVDQAPDDPVILSPYGIYTNRLQDIQPGSHLSTGILALGALRLAKERPELRHLSRANYARALRLTNDAVADPKRQKSVETVMTIWLLAQFEVSD